VWRWQERFMCEGVAGLLCEKTRKPRLPPLPAALVERVVALTLTEPPGEATHWTGRAMATATGVSLRSVQRILTAHCLQPHRVRRFKLSQDPAFAAKLRDVVGLYLDPPAHSLVLSVDEKSQIQALDRTQPGLPMKRGRAGTMTHDYIRHGTITLFAALNVLDGTVIGQCMARHRHQEFIRFLNRIEAVVPAGKLIPAILDNYAAHKHPKCAPGSTGTQVGRFISRPLPAPGPTPSRPSSLPSPAGVCNAGCSTRPRPQSTDTSGNTTPNPNPSSGPPIPIVLSRNLIVGIKCWRQTTGRFGAKSDKKIVDRSSGKSEFTEDTLHRNSDGMVVGVDRCWVVRAAGWAE
jgi:hypothetical protein